MLHTHTPHRPRGDSEGRQGGSLPKVCRPVDSRADEGRGKPSHKSQMSSGVTVSRASGYWLFI